MHLTFLGTRGEIRMASSLHRYHSSLLVEADDTRLLIDAGTDWRGRLGEFAPLTAILVTHAHPDHAEALRYGAPCPVYATAATHDLLERYPLDRRILAPGERTEVGTLTVSAHEAAHSLRAPAVGFRLQHGRTSFFYVPDVLELVDPASALRDLRLYVGDGATTGRPIVRRRDGEAFGHTTIEAQLDWCAAAGVGRALFTHCGSRIVRADPDDIAARVAVLGEQRGIAARIAYDGLAFELTEDRSSTSRTSASVRSGKDS